MSLTILGLLAHDIENRVNKLGPFSVVPFRPIVLGSVLPENVVIEPEGPTIQAGSDAIHGPRFEIHEHSPRESGCAAAGLVVVDIDPLELDVRVTLVATRRVDAMLGANHFPLDMAMGVEKRDPLGFPQWSPVRRHFGPNAPFISSSNMERKLLAKQVPSLLFSV
ncbi:tubulin beta 8 [Actinidia rufa]|uniref:Tubulin beta 8 n=1 Tax=Actinidia rufa TaxID=165716 RepID=A0A7J0FPY5_9ERIC|nr:tubulin beta 8 [Actinidia rufa]